jgi:hypothetical protein
MVGQQTQHNKEGPYGGLLQYMTDIKTSDDLLAFLVSQSQSGGKAWFGFPQQRIVGIYMCYELAKLHANTMTPNEVVEYAIELNNKIYSKIIKGDTL